MINKKSVMLIFSLTIFCLCANASQDANLTIISPNANICLSDSLEYDINLCDNQTLSIDGTVDHVIYVKNGLPIQNISNSTETLNYFVAQPINYISGFTIVLLFLMAFAATLLIIYLFVGAALWIFGAKKVI
jgi:hypothetical protein